MDFQFYIPVKVIFGQDAMSQFASLAKEPVLIVSTEILTQLGVTGKVAAACGGSPAVYDQVEANPTLSTVEAIASAIREQNIATVVAVGGGSSMDAAKAAASLAAGDTPLRDCLYHGAPVPARKVSLLVVPTTAGTGSEVTNVAVLSDPEQDRKTPLVSHSLWADAAMVIPEMTVTAPKGVTASTGFDALIHAVEAYWATSTQPASEALSLQAARLVCQNLRRAYDNGEDREAREGMMLGSLLAGMSFSQTRTTILHAASFPLTSDFHVDHGRACAVNMIPVLRYVSRHIPEKMRAMAVFCGYAGTEEWIDALEDLMAHCGMPLSLSEVGVKEDDISRLAAVTMSAPIARLTPAPMDEDIVRKLLADNLYSGREGGAAN